MNLRTRSICTLEKTNQIESDNLIVKDKRQNKLLHIIDCVGKQTDSQVRKVPPLLPFPPPAAFLITLTFLYCGIFHVRIHMLENVNVLTRAYGS